MLIDGHIHFDTPDVHDRFMADMRRTGATHFNILVYEPHVISPEFKQAEGIWLKLTHPDQAYLFGGLDLTGLSPTNSTPEVPLDAQLQAMIDANFDGLKLLAGKPNSRAAHGQPLDSPTFTPLLNLLEQTHFPVLWHVADPPEFWSEHTVPLWAKQNHWWYDNSVPTYETIDAEIHRVFQRHPKLNLILAHFFFYSNKLDRAADLLTRYPSFNIDLAPGVEMFHNFTANREASRNFFLRFADRIVFGTDIGVLNNSTGPDRGPMIRRFLETNDSFPVPTDPFMTPDDRPNLHGIALPQNVLDQIYFKNFTRITSPAPKKLNLPATKKILESLKKKSPAAQRTLAEFF